MVEPIDPLSIPISQADRAIERLLRDEIREELARQVGEREVVALGPEDEARIRTLIAQRVATYERRAATTNSTGITDPDGMRQRLFDGFLRMGILQPLLDSPTVEEVIVNSPNRVFVVEHGVKRFLPDIFFEDDNDVLNLVKRLLVPLGRRLDESSPMVDARLRDGSRLNAVTRPVAEETCLTIRKFLLTATSLEELVELGTLTEEVALFLDAAVQGGITILVSGPTASGKTTLLNALGASIPSTQERIITIEEVYELALRAHLPDCIALQARMSNAEGVGQISIRDLVRNALRMRPSRIIVGEVRGAEALDMLLSMNTGHPGSLATIHGDSPRDALNRLAILARMAEERLSDDAITRLIASTLHIVLQLKFDPHSRQRRLASVFEIAGIDTSASSAPILLGNDLWAVDQTTGRLTWQGIQPRCLPMLAARGVAYAVPGS